VDKFNISANSYMSLQSFITSASRMQPQSRDGCTIDWNETKYILVLCTVHYLQRTWHKQLDLEFISDSKPGKTITEKEVGW